MKIWIIKILRGIIMFNAIASMFWSLVKLIRFVLLMILFFYLIIIVGYLALCFVAFQNASK